MKIAALLLAGALASAPIAAYDLSMTADERKSCDEAYTRRQDALRGVEAHRRAAIRAQVAVI